MNDTPPGFRLYRMPEKGEFFIVAGDTSQGGADSNIHGYGSKTQSDVPLVFEMKGVAAEATPFLMEGLRWIFKKTGVKPVVSLERNNGGSSEMYDLIKYNTGEWTVYFMRDVKGVPNPDKPGWDTNVESRPRMLGEWKMAYESRAIKLYDEVIQDQHQTFIVNRTGKPEAAARTHDDGVMMMAQLWQLFQTENPPRNYHKEGYSRRPRRSTNRINLHV
jgi:hypothetical protein